jgi:hypothetical protein
MKTSKRIYDPSHYDCKQRADNELHILHVLACRWLASKPELLR